MPYQSREWVQCEQCTNPTFRIDRIQKDKMFIDGFEPIPRAHTQLLTRASYTDHGDENLSEMAKMGRQDR